MIDRAKLRAAWVAKGMKQSEVAKKIGMSDVTFSRKMKSGVFGTDEAEKMLNLLDIQNPAEIFFAKEVTSEVTM